MTDKQKSTVVEKLAVKNVRAERVLATKSGIQNMQAGQVDMDNSAVGYLHTQNLNQKHCVSGVIQAKSIKADQVKSVIALADHIDGDVQTIFDKKSAVAFAASLAGFLLIMRLLRRLFR